jgi:hypothetical protein
MTTAELNNRELGEIINDSLAELGLVGGDGQEPSANKSITQTMSENRSRLQHQLAEGLALALVALDRLPDGYAGVDGLKGVRELLSQFDVGMVWHYFEAAEQQADGHGPSLHVQDELVADTRATLLKDDPSLTNAREELRTLGLNFAS